MKRPDVILLDLDGTLVDATETIVEGILALAAESGLRVPQREEARAFIGRPPLQSWASLGAEDPAALVDAFTARVMPRLARDGVLLPGVGRAVPALRAAGHTLAVATTRMTGSARDSLEHVGLLASISQVSGRDLVPHPKPAPDVLLHALEALGRGPGDALMVGDSTADVEAAHAAGMPCWAVLGGIEDRAALRAAGADRILDGGVGELPAALGLAPS